MPTPKRSTLCLLTLLAALVVAGPAFADEIGYEVTGTYDSLTPTTSVSAPNTNFTFFFKEPSTLNSLITNPSPDTLLEFNNIVKFMGPATVVFLPSSTDDLAIELTTAANSYIWTFFGPQLFSGTSAPFTLFQGAFPLNFPTSGEFFDVGSQTDSFFSVGQVVAFPIPVPEPSSLALLGLGLGLLGLGSLLSKPLRLSYFPSQKD